MSMDERRRLLYQEYQPDPKLQQAVAIWLNYYKDTELFDIYRCRSRSPRNGHAIPMTQIGRAHV